MNISIDSTTKVAYVSGSLAARSVNAVKIVRKDGDDFGTNDITLALAYKSTPVANATLEVDNGVASGQINLNTVEMIDVLDEQGNPERITCRVEVYQSNGDDVPQTFIGSGEVMVSFNAIADVTAVDVDAQRFAEVSIPSGVDTLAVTFATPLSTVPSVIVNITKPTSASPTILGSAGSITVSGFTLTLTAETGSGGYKCVYLAKLAD